MEGSRPRLGPGAHADASGTTFVAWSTVARELAVRLFDAAGRPVRDVALEAVGDGRFEARLEGVRPGAHYKLVVDGDELPDPYARFLPFGVHGPARVTAPARAAALSPPRPLHELVVYEVHVGAFTEEGTYRAAAGRLDELVALGVTAVELMPLAAFPGTRGWGYDGVALFAPFAPYGEPDDLRAFVRAAHERGLAVILDVVYNHFGPSGNYLARYAPEYFTSEIETPWGAGPDFTTPAMRGLVLDNAAYWLDEFGFDALRLDATHAIHDPSRVHVVRALTELAHARTPPRLVFCEDERNEPAVLGALGADAVWADDLHHQIHVLLTGERDGYYAAYEPTVDALAACIRDGWTYTGQPYAPWSGRPRGKPLGGARRERLVTCTQNHDQVGNRAHGERLHHGVSLDAYLAASVLLLFLPTTPLLFMGQEWAASTPFLYFTDHEGELGLAVSNGRREEFKAFAAWGQGDGLAEVPDPQALGTFLRSKLRWDERAAPSHARALSVHRAMLALRRSDEVLSRGAQTGDLRTVARGSVLEVVRARGAATRALYANFGRGNAVFPGAARERVLLATGPVEGDALGPGAAVVTAGASH